MIYLQEITFKIKKAATDYCAYGTCSCDTHKDSWHYSIATEHGLLYFCSVSHALKWKERQEEIAQEEQYEDEYE